MRLIFLSDHPHAGATGPRQLVGICAHHHRRWQFDIIIVCMLVGFGLIDGLRRRIGKGLELLWTLEPMGDEYRDATVCLYCSQHQF